MTKQERYEQFKQLLIEEYGQPAEIVVERSATLAGYTIVRKIKALTWNPIPNGHRQMLTSLSIDCGSIEFVDFATHKDGHQSLTLRPYF